MVIQRKQIYTVSTVPEPGNIGSPPPQTQPTGVVTNFDPGYPPGGAAPEINSFEDVLVMIKPLSWWQGWVLSLIAIVSFIQSMTNLAVVFFQITPNYACTVPGMNETKWTLNNVKNISSPVKDKEIDACRWYSERPYEKLLEVNFSTAYDMATLFSNQNETIEECLKWTYDTTQDMEKTIVTEWNLICGRKFYAEHTQFVYMGGFLIGSLFSGPIADAIGRKITFIGASILCSGFGIAESFAPNYVVFLVFRFIMAVSYIASCMAYFTEGLEIVTARYRVWVGGLAFIPYATGYTLLALVAYLTKDWRWMHFAITAPGIISLAYWWIFPESPRWLLVKGRVEEAEKVLRMAAKINQVELPPDIDFHKIAKVVADEAHLAAEKQTNIIHVFKYPVLACRAVNVFFNWIVNNMVYYGVSLNVSSFAGDKFVNNAIAGALEFPAYFLCVPLLAWGRVRSLSLALVLTGVSLFIVPWIEIDWLRTTFAMIGKFCITISYGLVYVATPEMYPTVVRTSGLSASSCFGRIGSMVAPYIGSISKLGKSMEWIPMVVFGVFSIAAGLLALLLPETKGKKLPEHIEDALELESEKEQKPDEKYQMQQSTHF